MTYNKRVSTSLPEHTLSQTTRLQPYKTPTSGTRCNIYVIKLYVYFQRLWYCLIVGNATVWRDASQGFRKYAETNIGTKRARITGYSRYDSLPQKSLQKKIQDMAGGDEAKVLTEYRTYTSDSWDYLIDARMRGSLKKIEIFGGQTNWIMHTVNLEVAQMMLRASWVPWAHWRRCPRNGIITGLCLNGHGMTGCISALKIWTLEFAMVLVLERRGDVCRESSDAQIWKK